MSVIERRNKGINFLEDKNDFIWQHEINLNLLNMHYTNACILGQIYGNYNQALIDLDINEDDAINYGFTNIKDEDDDDFLEDETKLRLAWIEYIIGWRKINGGRQDFQLSLRIDGKEFVPTKKLLEAYAELL